VAYEFLLGLALCKFKRNLWQFEVPKHSLNARMTPASSAKEYLLKAQVMGYESHRAMFEAYSLNKYVSTGVIQWMLNNPWPEMVWHLYDFYLNQGGSYFGTKKACELVHIQYSYKTKGVSIVNSKYTPYPLNSSKPVTASLEMYSATGEKVYTHTAVVAPLSVPSDGALLDIISVPDYKGTGNTYFIHLTLISESDVISSNTYWLSTKQDNLNYGASTWYNTPCTSYANFSALMNLPQVSLSSSMKYAPNGKNSKATITITNPTNSIAFFIRLRLVKSSDSSDVLPIIWDDNMFSLFPQTSRVLNAVFDEALLQGSPQLVVELWNDIIQQK